MTQASPADLANVHGAGYQGALDAGVLTVMTSFSSWIDSAAYVEHGKMHGNATLMTGVLKERLGFDGLIVSDWDGVGQVPGCKPEHCPAAINAGIDVVMVPFKWKAFYENTLDDVEQGRIPMARIDDAVRRVLRVKFSMSVPTSVPSTVEAMQAPETGAPRGARVPGAAEEQARPCCRSRARRASLSSARRPTAWPTRPAAGA